MVSSFQAVLKKLSALLMEVFSIQRCPDKELYIHIHTCTGDHELPNRSVILIALLTTGSSITTGSKHNGLFIKDRTGEISCEVSHNNILWLREIFHTLVKFFINF